MSAARILYVISLLLVLLAVVGVAAMPLWIPLMLTIIGLLVG